MNFVLLLFFASSWISLSEEETVLYYIFDVVVLVDVAWWCQANGTFHVKQQQKVVS